MPDETLHIPRPEMEPQSTQPYASMAIHSPLSEQKPFYALDETEIRAEIARALSEKPVEAPQWVYLTDSYTSGREEDVSKAYTQAHAEHPYRLAAKAAWDEGLATIEPLYSVPGGKLLDLVRHPFKAAKGTKKIAERVLLELKAEHAAQIVGDQYDRMVAAALPFVPKLEMPHLFGQEAVEIDVSLSPDYQAVADAAEKKHMLATEQLVEQLRLDEQLGEQITVLARNGIVKPLRRRGGELGLIDEAGREYPAPTPAQLREMVERNLGLIKYKASQGFTRLLAVPEVTSGDRLEESMGDAVVDHFRRDALRYSSGDPVLLNPYYQTHAAKDTYAPLTRGMPEGMIHDLDDETYTHSGTHKGKHHQENATIPGWKIVLVRNMPETPHTARDLVFIGGRPELLPGAKPQQYLDVLHSHPTFRGEEGFTLKMWYAYALTMLERDDVLIDSRGGTLLLGSYKMGEGFSRRRLVPWVGWSRENPKAEGTLKLTMGGMPPKMPDYGNGLGVRTAVVLS